MTAVVSDSSPLHYLIEADVVDALHKIFGEVVIPPAVFQELQHERTPHNVSAWITDRPTWLRVQAPVSIDQTLAVHPGEREAISLAIEIKAELLLSDDRRGRNEAKRRGLAVMGTIGFLESAAKGGFLDFNYTIARLRGTRARLDED